MPAAHTQPAGARRQEAAVLDPQDRPLPPAALAPQMPQGMLGTAGPSRTCQCGRQTRACVKMPFVDSPNLFIWSIRISLQLTV